MLIVQYTIDSYKGFEIRILLKIVKLLAFDV